MVGLVSVGAYVPRYRLTGALLREAWGGAGDGERALANHDEDSLTMACEAALAALTGRDVSRVGACFLASTSAPSAEKSTATLLASVCDLAPDAITADLGGSLRCGTTALRLALDSVRAGSVAEALVAAADVRTVPPGTELEGLLGDGAAAALVGADGVVASFEGAHTVSREFTDVWRNQGGRYLNVLPDMPFVKAHGLDRHLPEAIDGLLAKTGRKKSDVTRLVLGAPDARLHAALVRQLAFAAAVPKETLTTKVGITGPAAGLPGLAGYCVGVVCGAGGGKKRGSRGGGVFTFTRDFLVPPPDPPTVVVSSDLEGGGRFFAQLTDVDPATVTVDMPVELTFRRIHEGDDLVNYFWKFRPAGIG